MFVLQLVPGVPEVLALHCYGHLWRRDSPVHQRILRQNGFVAHTGELAYTYTGVPVLVYTGF